MADRPKASGYDYSRRLYSSDREYFDHMRKTSDKHRDTKYLEKHSEFKKPWFPDVEFDEMEYWLDPPPGIDPWILDDPGVTVDIEDPRGDGGVSVLYCQITGCFLEDNTTCVDLNCSYTPVGAWFTHTTPPGMSLAISGNALCITAPASAPPAIEVSIEMQGTGPDGQFVQGSHDSIMITQCSVDCSDPEELTWDEELNPETMGRYTSRTVQVTGGEGPYFWSITGHDVRLGHSMTNGKGNTVYTGLEACGPIEIFVTDACGQETYGGIRCTYGVLKGCPGVDCRKLKLGATPRCNGPLTYWVANVYRVYVLGARCQYNEDEGWAADAWWECPTFAMPRTWYNANDVASGGCIGSCGAWGDLGFVFHCNSDRYPGHTEYWDCP